METNHGDMDLEGSHLELDDHFIHVFLENQKAMWPRLEFFFNELKPGVTSSALSSYSIEL